MTPWFEKAVTENENKDDVCNSEESYLSTNSQIQEKINKTQNLDNEDKDVSNLKSLVKDFF